jgi:hypothetical protein
MQSTDTDQVPTLPIHIDDAEDVSVPVAARSATFTWPLSATRTSGLPTRSPVRKPVAAIAEPPKPIVVRAPVIAPVIAPEIETSPEISTSSHMTFGAGMLHAQKRRRSPIVVLLVLAALAAIAYLVIH